MSLMVTSADGWVMLALMLVCLGPVARPSPRRRRQAHDSYVADLVARDVAQLSGIQRAAQMRALIRLLAARSTQLLIAAKVSSEAGISQATALRYIGLLGLVWK